MALRSLGIVIALTALTSCSDGQASSGPVQQVSAIDETIPGPRDCFWRRGPFGADPYINIAYPDANVFYWAGVFSVPEGARLQLEGEFPASRYMSFVSYTTAGHPIESLPDFLINADQGENPFIEDAARSGDMNQYSIEVRSSEPETVRDIGSREANGPTNALHAPADEAGGPQTILYRIYLPDDGTAPTGDVGLPQPVLTLASGDTLHGPEACQALRTRQPAVMASGAASITPAQYRALITQPNRPDTWPAQSPAEWFIQLDRESLLGIYTGQINEDARRSEGGFYPNPDNFYIRTIVNRKHGPVFLVRAKAPTTPATFNSETRMGEGQLRYWSICSNQSFVNTRVNDCLFDEEIPLDPRGFFTVVISREEDRPRNARPDCGLSWLPMADDGDGMFDEDVTIVQIRHMLGADDFANSIERVERQDDLESVLGPYMPRTQYLQTNQVEALFPCPAP
jgi:hypothetical protein